MHYYIVRPVNDIQNMCEEFLDRDTSFHSEITIVDGNTILRAPAWQVTLSELRIIYKAAGDKGVSLTGFRVAVKRNLKKETIRWAQKKEYIIGYQSQNKRPEALKRILAERKKRFC